MTSPPMTPPTALVAFHDGGDARHPLGFLLKRGFKHCFVAVRAGEYWLTLDGRAGVPAFEVVAGAEFDLAAHYRAHGLTVIETAPRGRPRRAPLALANCVGLVKAVLCLRAWAVTPHALYRHLVKESDA